MIHSQHSQVYLKATALVPLTRGFDHSVILMTQLPNTTKGIRWLMNSFLIFHTTNPPLPNHLPCPNVPSTFLLIIIQITNTTFYENIHPSSSNLATAQLICHSTSHHFLHPTQSWLQNQLNSHHLYISWQHPLFIPPLNMCTPILSQYSLLLGCDFLRWCLW